MLSAHTERFAQVVAQDDPALELDLAMFLIAAHERPELDIAGEIRKLDDLASRCPAPTLDGVSRQLFQFDGFVGNSASYYDADNSLLDQVLQRKIGIPITLSVLAIEVGRRLGVPMAPVGMPGHFLVRDRVLPDVFLDPFHGGAILTSAQCRRFFHTVHGPQAPWADEYLAPIPKRAVLFRTLNNLRAISHNAGETEREIWVLRLMSRIPGMPHEPATDLAERLVSQGRFGEAAAELELFAQSLAGSTAGTMPQIVEQIRQKAHVLRSRLN